MLYQTTNIAVAAALKSIGHRIEHIEVNGRIATFFFPEHSRDTALLIELGEQLVDAIRFHQELRRLSGLARSMVTS